MIRQSIVTAEAYYSAVAEYCGVPFLPERSFRPLVINDVVLHCGPGDAGPLMIGLRNRGPIFVIAPPLDRIALVRAHLLRHVDWAQNIRIAAPESVRQALTMLKAPTGEIETRFPEFSARRRISRGQKLGLIAIAMGAALGALLPATVFLVLGSFVVGLSCVLTGIARLAGAQATRDAVDSDPCDISAVDEDSALPTYTVLVPLYKEAQIVRGLLAALERIDYPRERLEIKFLVEQEDVETRLAFAGLVQPHMEVLVVPLGEPRTKPRALSYGLFTARGEFLTIYDAEDRPEPLQLRKAVAAFSNAPENLACLQASLCIDNAGDSFFTRQFAIEYAALFDQIIPWFSMEAWPFPLGGSSNHFRRSALIAVGGWDPYNVTEDADLGLRLARFGFTSAALASTTFEEAPVTWRAWYAQRARWYKGWLQTCFVHLREPSRLWRDLGPRRAIPIGAMIAGSLLTLAIHPFFFVMLYGYALGLWSVPLPGGLLADMIVSLSALAVLAGYGGTAISSWSAAHRRGFRPRLLDLAGIPLYWLCASAAFYRAVWDFAVRPHHWHKTEHGTARRRQNIEESGTDDLDTV
ncbi:glycosyltransferase family 2 protein [Polymorphum gilvum]|nr:glycosyltransferase family 2 protein [Polymorphum gilvum]